MERPVIEGPTHTAQATDSLMEATGGPSPVGGHHPSREGFDRQLRTVKDGVLRMGSLVEEQILGALQTIVERDPDRARAIVAADAGVNELQRTVEALITKTIATQSPVARDLRFLLALDRVTYELERIGDHAAAIAKQAGRLAGLPPLARQVDLPRMATLAAQQVHGVLLALVDVDVARARQVAAGDDEIDAIYHALFDEILGLMRADPANVEPGTRVLLAAHYLERIGDRVTNVAEDVVFLATGEIEDLNR